MFQSSVHNTIIKVSNLSQQVNKKHIQVPQNSTKPKASTVICRNPLMWRHDLLQKVCIIKHSI